VSEISQTIRVPTNEIRDWDTFHDVSQRVFGFPDFYGRNMNAWIDCMTSPDDPDDGMTSVKVSAGELLVIELPNAAAFKKRCPEQFDALIECIAFVNHRRVAIGERAVLALLPID